MRHIGLFPYYSSYRPGWSWRNFRIGSTHSLQWTFFFLVSRFGKLRHVEYNKHATWKRQPNFVYNFRSSFSQSIYRRSHHSQHMSNISQLLDSESYINCLWWRCTFDYRLRLCHNWLRNSFHRPSNRTIQYLHRLDNIGLPKLDHMQLFLSLLLQWNSDVPRTCWSYRRHLPNNRLNVVCYHLYTVSTSRLRKFQLYCRCFWSNNCKWLGCIRGHFS